MQNFIQPGEMLELTAPYATLAGAGCLVGSTFGVAKNDVAISKVGQYLTEGVHNLAKTSAQAWVDGQKIAWDDANKRCDSDLTKGTLVGHACNGGAANPSSVGPVKLVGIPCPRAVTVAMESSGAPASDGTAGNLTVTAAQLLAGIFVRDPNGASRTDTLPTAALLVAAVPGAKVGDVIKTYIINGADAAEVITLAAGSGGAFDANQQASARVIGQNTSKMLHVRLTNVTASSEAYVAYA